MTSPGTWVVGSAGLTAVRIPTAVFMVGVLRLSERSDDTTVVTAECLRTTSLAPVSAGLCTLCALLCDGHPLSHFKPLSGVS